MLHFGAGAKAMDEREAGETGVKSYKKSCSIVTAIIPFHSAPPPSLSSLGLGVRRAAMAVRLPETRWQY